MKERIIVVSGLNGTELMRSLAMHGRKRIGTRVMNPVEFAQYALTVSGSILRGTFISHDESASIIYSFLKEIPYFENASYTDAAKLQTTLSQIRRFITGNSNDESELLKNRLPDGHFPEKNAALLEVYRRYRDYREIHGLLDGEDILRFASTQIRPCENAELIELAEYPLLPLEKSVFDLFAGSDSSVETLQMLYDVRDGNAGANAGITQAYGAINEIEDIFGQIVRRKLPLDSCLIVTASTQVYPQTILDCAQRYDLPVTFGCGIPMTNTFPAKLLLSWIDWTNAGYGVDGLKKLLSCPALDIEKLLKDAGIDSKDLRRDDMIKTAGYLRLSPDADINRVRIDAYRAALPNSGSEEDTKALKYLEIAEKLFSIISRGCENFIYRYSRIRFGEMRTADLSARNMISVRLRAYERYATRPVADIMTYLRSGTCGCQGSREGSIHVTDMNAAPAVMRKNIFITGMSAANFPGAPTENYLMPDDDYRLISDSPLLPLSDSLVRRSIARFEQLTALADALGTPAFLSFSNYSAAELKNENPSSVLELPENPRKAGFFDHAFTAANVLGRAYGESKVILHAPVERTPSLRGNEDHAERTFSPTAITDFFSCPRHFYYERLMGIRPEDPDDPNKVINALDLGTVVHACMEILKTGMTEDTFMAYADAQFDLFLKRRPPVIPSAAEKVRTEFMDMVRSAYRSDPGNKTVAVEEEVEAVIEGVHLKGRLDRLEQDENGDLIIADYKTNSKLKHIENDIDTCMQALLYAAMLEENGRRIARCEYRYVRLGKTISCEYTETARAALRENLKLFKQCILDGRFPVSLDDENAVECDACKYCKVKSICGRGETDEYMG